MITCVNSHCTLSSFPAHNKLQLQIQLLTNESYVRTIRYLLTTRHDTTREYTKATRARTCSLNALHIFLRLCKVSVANPRLAHSRSRKLSWNFFRSQTRSDNVAIVKVNLDSSIISRIPNIGFEIQVIAYKECGDHGRPRRCREGETATPGEEMAEKNEERRQKLANVEGGTLTGHWPRRVEPLAERTSPRKKGSVLACPRSARGLTLYIARTPRSGTSRGPSYPGSAEIFTLWNV
ncbi:uncharacterized protein LOC114944819 isoform X2 [Nylanderia fulva]|uniref:uncharacterized protein LOC114944819 isoform X2 n=1 Tax=Nylanderia fulva TaxID=613905 RepID=UPI0010FB8EF2|nr:uncharacterized protein LOC114944819 isoform X2 [Nylanderia fulva]